MRRPRVKPHVAIVPVTADAVLLRGPALFVRYAGEAVPLLLDVAAKLDGTRSLEEVARDAGRPLDEVREVVDALASDGVLEDAAQDDELPLDADERARLDPQLQLLSHLTALPARAQARISSARVVVLGEGALADAVASNLAACAVGRVERPQVADWRRAQPADLRPLVEGATHAVLALERPLTYAYLGVNEAALAAGVPWTAVLLEGLDASVGPTVVPGQSACWRCYDLRVKGAHPSMERLLAYEANARDASRPVGLPTFSAACGAMAAQSVVLALSGAVPPPLAGHVLRVALLDGQAQRHRVLRMPRCPACGRGAVPDIDRYALDPGALP